MSEETDKKKERIQWPRAIVAGLIVLILIISSCNQSNEKQASNNQLSKKKENQIIGTWRGHTAGKDVNVVFVFNQDFTFKYNFENGPRQGELVSGKYTIDEENYHVKEGGSVGASINVIVGGKSYSGGFLKYNPNELVIEIFYTDKPLELYFLFRPKN